MNTFKTIQEDNERYIFCITFDLNEQKFIKIPIEMVIITALVIDNQMMLYYKCNVQPVYKVADFVLINNAEKLKLVKQFSLGIVASVTLNSEKITYDLHEINPSLNFIL